MEIIKNLIFISILIYAGIYDYRKRIIPDKVHLIILMSAVLTDFNPIQSIIGLLILSIPFIIPIFFSENSIGGGDIKFVGSIGFFLGLNKGLVAIVIGLLLSIIVSIIKKKDRNQSVPLGPYLATGSILTFLI